MDFLIYILLLLLTGCLGGFLAGLLGIGGGIILTPLQFFLLESIGVAPKTAIVVSFATSLAIIFVTMLNSTRHHYNNGLVETKNLWILALLGFIGSVCGALIGTSLDVSILKVIFGLMCILSAVGMLVIKYPDDDSLIDTNKIKYIILGLITGILSGLLGVGGGVIMIPALTLALHYPTHKAIGTSSATIIFTALGGIIAYILLGWNVKGLPAFSFGYINILQFVFITITSTIMAGQAAILSRKISADRLKILHVVLITIIGIKMIGLI